MTGANSAESVHETSPQLDRSAVARAGISRHVNDVILDTNAVLDWLVFDDPAARSLGESVCTRRLRWIATEPMRTELLDVLDRLETHPPLMRWQAARAPALVQVERWMQLVPTPDPLSAALRLHSTDPDDQCFIDLALSRRVPWLISRDRALLRLAGKARPRGVAVLTPQRWAALADPAGLDHSPA